MGVKFFDVLGINPRIYLNSEKRKKTKYGGAVSLVMILLIFCSIFYFFFELILRESFTLIYNQTVDFNPTLNISNIPLVFGFADQYANPIKNLENQIRIYGEYYQMNKNYDSDKPVLLGIKQLKMEKCDINKHFGNYYSFFTKYAAMLDKFYCLPINEHNLTLYGTWGDSQNPNSYLVLKIAKCFNNENKEIFPDANCFNRTTIDSNLMNIYLNIVTLDYEINHTNVKNPDIISIRSDTFSLSSSVFNRYEIKKKIVNYQTDHGILFPILDYKQFFQYDISSLNTDLRVNISPIGLFGQISFSLSKKTDNYKRNYIKIQNVLANIGGIVDAIYIVFSLLFKYIMKGNYYNDLGNLVYNRCMDNSELENNNTNAKKLYSKILKNEINEMQVKEYNYAKKCNSVANLQALNISNNENNISNVEEQGINNLLKR